MNFSTLDFDTIFLFAVILIILAGLFDFFLFFRWVVRKTPTFNKVLSPAKEVIKKLSRNKKEPDIALAEAQTPSPAINLIWRFRHLYFNILILVFSYILLSQAWMAEPRIQSSTPGQEMNWSSYDVPIEIVFNVPISTSKLNPKLSQEQLTGTWVYEPYFGIQSLTRKALFYPTTTIMPNQRVVAYMTGVSRSWVDESHEHALNFYSPKLPEITATTPVHHQENISVDSEVKITLSKPLTQSARWDFQLEPAVEFETITQDPQTLVLKFKEALQQGTLYSIKVLRTAVTYNTQTLEPINSANPELVHLLSFSTVKEPLVSAITPSGTGVLPTAVIQVEFDLPMVQATVENGLTISPAIEGTLTWVDERTFTYTPKNLLPKEIEYTISFPAGLETKYGGKTEREITHKFVTIGAIQVVEYTPTPGLTGVNRLSPNISVLFDQEVDHDSAQQHFNMSPGAAGTISWSGNRLIFTPSVPLEFSTTYVITLTPGIKTINGLDSRDTFSSSFTTNSNVTLVPGFSSGSIDLQDYTFTCAVAATKMALTWKGVSISEDGIIARVGQDTSSMDCTSGTCIWGDPNRNYLGYGNGSGTYGTGMSGYGVHWLPMINVFSQFGIYTELHRNWNIYALAETLKQGHPVQIWWWNGVSNYYGRPGGTALTWNDRITGQPVEAINGMHSVLIIGFYGDSTNPTSFIVLDPWWGYQVYSTAKINNQWPKLGNTGVVIF